METFKESKLLCTFPQKAIFGGNLQCSIFVVEIFQQNKLIVILFQTAFFFWNFPIKQTFVEMF